MSLRKLNCNNIPFNDCSIQLKYRLIKEFDQTLITLSGNEPVQLLEFYFNMRKYKSYWVNLNQHSKFGQVIDNVKQFTEMCHKMIKLIIYQS